MESQGRILIIEDDADISMIEETYLQSAGYETVTRVDGDGVLEVMEGQGFDLVLLDLMLPGRSGYEICREIRERYDIPILMVTARGEAVDKIKGFNIGADDYIAKPFDPMELTARVGANIRQYRRIRGGAATAQAEAQPAETPAAVTVREPEQIEVDGLRILTDSWRVYRGDVEIKLTNKEFEILRLMVQNPNIVFSREQLMNRIWGYDYVADTTTVMVHINRLRDKIELDPRNPKIIETVWGAGYRLNR